MNLTIYSDIDRFHLVQQRFPMGLWKLDVQLQLVLALQSLIQVVDSQRGVRMVKRDPFAKWLCNDDLSILEGHQM